MPILGEFTRLSWGSSHAYLWVVHDRTPLRRALRPAAFGGALGATLRFLFSGWALRTLGTGFPWGTFGVNVIGAFAMGLAAVVLMERAPGAWARFAPLVMTGVLGGFTTFSAFSLDVLYLLERGRMGVAAGYMLGSVAASVFALWAGLSLGRAVFVEG